MTLSDFRQYGKVGATRFNDGEVALYITKTGPVWRVLANQDGVCCAVGGHAATKFEAMVAILPQVAKNHGFQI